MRVFIILLFLSVMSFARAEGEAEDLMKIATLAEDVRDAIAEGPDGPLKDGEFKASQEDADLIVAMAEEDQLIMELQDIATRENLKRGDCNPAGDDESKESDAELVAKKKKKRFRILMTMRYKDPKVFETARGFYGMDRFSNWYLANLAPKPGFSVLYSNLDTFKETYKTAHPEVDFDSLSLVDQQKKLAEWIKERGGGDVPKNLILRELTVDHLINNSADWRNTLRSVGPELTFNDKMQIVTKLGGDMGDRYNYDRADGKGDHGKGIVTVEEMLDSVKNFSPGGICRDVASTQAQMLKEMGVDHAYILSYKTPGGFHSNLVAQNPDDPDNVVKVNYGYAHEENGQSGAALLSQDTNMPDVGLQYKIYSAEGKPLTKIPSDLGQMLRTVTGGKKKPHENHQYSLNRVAVETPYGRGNLFTGQLTSGEKVVGFAIDHRLNLTGSRDILNVEAGIAASRVEGSRTLVQIEQDNLYARARAELNTPWLKAGKFAMRAESSAEGQFMISNNQITYKSDASKETFKSDWSRPSFDASLGVRGVYQGDKTSVDTSVRGNFFDAFEEHRASEKTTIVLDNITIDSALRHQFRDDMAFLAQTGIVLRSFKGEEGIGDSWYFKTGIEKDFGDGNHLGGFGSASGPFQKDQFRGLDGSTYRFGGGMSYRRDGLSGMLGIELDEAQDFKRPTIVFGFEWKF